MEIKEEIGERINQLRIENSWSKEELARKIGITGQSLGQVIKGAHMLSPIYLKKLCELTGKSADYILFGVDNPLVRYLPSYFSQYSEEQIKNTFALLEKVALFMYSNSNQMH